MVLYTFLDAVLGPLHYPGSSEGRGGRGRERGDRGVEGGGRIGKAGRVKSERVNTSHFLDKCKHLKHLRDQS